MRCYGIIGGIYQMQMLKMHKIFYKLRKLFNFFKNDVIS
jgi:hypothetical protein